jgi:hypothetical protein
MGVENGGKAASLKILATDESLYRREPGVSSNIPAEITNTETYYLLKHRDDETPVVVTLLHGKKIHGIIEWCDQDCIKVRRMDGLGMVIMKSIIKDLHKELPVALP